MLTYYKALAEVSKFVFRHTFPQALLSLVKQEITSSSDTKKLLAGVNVYVPTGSNNLTVTLCGCIRLCGLLQFPGVRRRTLNKLMILLCHRIPRVNVAWYSIVL